MRARIVIRDTKTGAVVYSEGVPFWESVDALDRLAWQHRNRIARIFKRPVRRYRYEITGATSESVTADAA